MAVYLSAPPVAHFPSRIRAAGLLIRARWNARSARPPSARSRRHRRRTILRGPAPTCGSPYDLLGALFARPDLGPVSRHADKLFARIRSVIKDRFADPDFGPPEVAAETGISLRYVQKLLRQRLYVQQIGILYSFGSCRVPSGSPGVASIRVSLGEIAYACGFRDYVHFARKFRHRFGHAPKSTPKDAVPVATAQWAPVLVSIRHPLTTLALRLRCRSGACLRRTRQAEAP